LLQRVIDSFGVGQSNNGLPLGNLTSQLFANIYLNQFDQFVKYHLKARYYIRYADDFVIFSSDKGRLIQQVALIKEFLQNNLNLELHPNKLFLRTVSSGLDFLGWVNFPDHRVLRRATKDRMFRRLKVNSGKESINSYLGLLSHGNAQKLSSVVRSNFRI